MMMLYYFSVSMHLITWHRCTVYVAALNISPWCLFHSRCLLCSLAAIARKRTQHFSVILSTLLDFNVMNYERVKGFHAFSVQYSLKSAFLGFLRCTYPPIIEVYIFQVLSV